MFVGAGVGAYAAGMFHLVTHAFFKALLFLGAGSVMHGLSGETDLRKMGGLASKMPVTRWTFTIGALALAGIFPFSGFFSKDEILWQAYLRSPLLYALTLLTAVMTSFYIFRVVFKAFHGRPTTQHAHESPPSMTLPLVVLGILAAVGGFFPVSEMLRRSTLGGFAWYRESSPPVASLQTQHVLMTVTTVLALLAIYAAYQLYVKRPGTAAALARRFPTLYRLVSNKYYVDEIYDALFVRPGKSLALGLYRWIDSKAIDGTVNGAAAAVGYASKRLRLAETGYVRNYALAMLAGAVLLIAYLSLR
jgi:NADH-quinone oxidoreductase subunit L